MKKFIILISVCILVQGCSSAVKPQMQTFMGKAVFDVTITTQPKEVVSDVYESINMRADRLTKTVAFMPSALPDQPGTPNIGIKSMGMGFLSLSMPQTSCDGAYAVMSGFDKGVSSSAYGTYDFASYTGCIYPYKEAYRIYLIGNFVSSSPGGIQGMLADAIKKGVASASKYDNIYAAWFDTVINKMREKFPDAKEIEIAMP